ncbi:MAG: sulfotransferase [Planctomycetaceae bacterium]
MTQPAHLNNFADPFGLLKRMLTSGNRAAYAALLREGLSIAAKPADWLLSGFEQRRLKAAPTSEHPLILIVGAPRSGTTLVYQVLAAYLDVTTPSNLTSMFPRSPLTVAKLQQRLPFSTRPDFQNFYGQTAKLSGPNDAFHLWNRWLGSDRYQPAEALSDDVADDMRRFFAAWTSAFHRPFLNKNNRNTACIRLLADTLPQARFVVVQRNPVFVAQSLIRAREQVQGDKHIGWGLNSQSPETDETSEDSLAYIDQVCQQVEDISRDLQQQLSAVAPDRILQLSYEDFCNDPQTGIQSITAAFPGLQLNPAFPLSDLNPFRVSNRSTLTEAEQQRLIRNFGQIPTATAG